MADDIALQNFMMNTLRGTGTGGSTGASSSLNEAFPSLLTGNVFNYSGFENVEQKIQPAALLFLSKFFSAIQGQKGQLSIQQVSLLGNSQFQPPPSILGAIQPRGIISKKSR
jgi:hypothetical protein